MYVAGSIVSCVLGRVCLPRVCSSFICGSILFSLRSSPWLVDLVAEINTLQQTQYIVLMLPYI